MQHILTVLSVGAVQKADITAVAVCIGIGLLIGLITVLVMKSQLKTVRPRNAAADYVVQGSFQLHHSQDIFLYRHVHRSPRPKNNNK